MWTFSWRANPGGLTGPDRDGPAATRRYTELVKFMSCPVTLAYGVCRALYWDWEGAVL
jgi:hypothetical protein